MMRYCRTWLWLISCGLCCMAYQQHGITEIIQRAENIATLADTVIEADIQITGLRTPSQWVGNLDLTAYQLGKVKVQLTWQLEQPPQLGDIWQVRLTLRPLSSRLNDGGFNRQRWLLSQSILASVTVKQGELRWRQASWRQRKLAEVVQQTQHLRYQGIILALAFGERAWLDSTDWLQVRESGIAHLIAISGLHIGLVAWLAWGAAHLVQIGLKPRYISYWLPHIAALIAALGYAYLADFHIPTQRALWAYIIWLILVIGRIYLPAWKLLILVAAWLTILNPLSVLSESFWLSFGAVAALCALYYFFPLSALQWRNKPLKQQVPKICYWLFGLLHLQLGLLLLFTPLQIWIFEALPLGALWSNVVLVPIFSIIIVPLILLNILFEFAWLWQIIERILDGSLTLLSILPNHYQLLSGQQQMLITIMCLSLLLGLLLYRTLYLTPQKIPTLAACKYASLLVILSIVGCISIVGFRQWYKSDWRLEMLDVGQGLAVLLVSENKAMLFDTGKSWAGGSMAEAEILPYLQRQGLFLEQIILSHDDNDHAGGVPSLLKAFPSAVLVQASKKNYAAKQRKICRRGEQWQWRGFQLVALSPLVLPEVAKNRDSCVLLIERDNVRLVLNGDIDQYIENQLAAKIGKIDWLQVAHHGSNSSSGWRWLAKLQPTVSLISSGRFNPWRLPHSDVLRRLKYVQSAVYNTALDGQISIEVKNGSWKLTTMRRGGIKRIVPWYQIIIGADQ